MKTKFLGMILLGLAGLAGGCGKTENPAPNEPAKAAERPSPPATQSPAAIAATTRQAADTTAKIAEAPPAPAVPVVAAPPAAAPAIPAPATAPSAVSQAATGLAELSQDQVVQGLQAALGKGLQSAIANLGHDGGFLTNLNVKIPMPDALKKVETALRAMKQDQLADDFITTMNHAAEQAVPEAGSVFADALKHMTIDDAKSILSGPNDAATQYFQRTTQTNLYAKFYPIVQKATAATGTTAAYKNLLAKTEVTKSLGAFGSALSGSLAGKDTLDVDGYVTTKAMDGLFKIVADEEKQIRQNPVARTTDVLQKVFGALKK